MTGSLAHLRAGTGAIELTHPWRPLFLRNSEDIFILSTPLDIGIVESITIRHDSDGYGANTCWFLGHVEVLNLHLGRTSKRMFWVDNWLALDAGLCKTAVTVVGTTMAEVSTVKHLILASIPLFVFVESKLNEVTVVPAGRSEC